MEREHEADRSKVEQQVGQLEPDLPEHHEQQATAEPRIYVASLSDYNNGILHGTWIDAAQELEELSAEVARMLAQSQVPGAEEYAIHDYEGFGGVRLDEHETLRTVSRLANGIVEHGEALALLAAYASLDDLDFLEAAIRDSYLGMWESLDDFVSHVVDDMGIETYIEHAPASYRQYLTIDRDKLAGNLEMELTILEGSGGRVHVFDPNR